MVLQRSVIIMTTIIRDGFIKIKQIRYLPMAYFTQNQSFSKCPRELLKSLSTLDMDLENGKLYFAFTHNVVNNRITRNDRLRILFKIKVSCDRDITIHNQRLFSSCSKCVNQCQYSELGNKQLKNIDGYFIAFYKKF